MPYKCSNYIIIIITINDNNTCNYNDRDVMDSESSTFLKSEINRYLKSDHNGFTDLEIVVSVQFIYCL